MFEYPEHLTAMAWHPEGKLLAYGRARYGDKPAMSIEVAGPVERRPAVLYSAETPSPGFNAVWPRDDRIIFTAAEGQPGSRDANIWELKLDARTASPQGLAKRLTNWLNTKAMCTSASWSLVGRA